MKKPITKLRRILAVPTLAVMPVAGVVSVAHPYGIADAGHPTSVQALARTDVISGGGR